MNKSIFLLAFLSISCFNNNLFEKKNKLRKLKYHLENFNDEKTFNYFWNNASQNTSNKKYHLENNTIKLSTKKGSKERVKIIFNKNNLTFGTYEWKVFVPKMKLKENCSIGAFLYADDRHELDFEIGSGNSSDRNKYKPKPNELLLFCSSQENPYSSFAFKLKDESWYSLKLKLTRGIKNDYLVKWYVNEKKIHELQLNYGKKIKFEALCSLENIHFIGDKPTSVDNYTYFDSFEYSSIK